MFSGSPKSFLRRNLENQPRGFTLVELLVVISIIGILTALLLPAVQAAREASRSSKCRNNLKQMALALQIYHGQQTQFPPGGNLRETDQPDLGLSWRVHILPQLEQQVMYDQIDPQPHGGPHSWAAMDDMPVVYHCPSNISESSSPIVESNYAGISGAYRGLKYIDLETKRCGRIFTNGIFYPDSRTKIAEITDGTSNTLLIGERTYTFVNWMTGTGRRQSDPRICTGASKNILFPINANKDVYGYYRSDPNRPEDAITCLTMDDDECMSLNNLLFGSNHPGGAQFSMADGSVHFISDTIDFTVYQDLATKAGEETNRWNP